MKKMINAAFTYFVLAIAAGVFFREFTKFNGYTAKTVLSCVHPHLFVLGMFLFLIIALFCKNDDAILNNKTFKRVFVLYNIFLPFMAMTMMIRGIAQVLNITLTQAMNGMLAGFAGISNIMMAVSLVLLLLALKKTLVQGGEK